MNTNSQGGGLFVIGMGAVTGACHNINEFDHALFKSLNTLREIDQGVRVLRGCKLPYGSAIHSLTSKSLSPERFSRDELLQQVINRSLKDLVTPLIEKKIALLVIQKEHHDPVASETTKPFGQFRSFARFGAAVSEAAKLLNEDVTAVVIASAEMLGPSFDKYLKKQRLNPALQHQTLVFADGVTSQGIGEGAAAVILTSQKNSTGQRIYSSIESICSGESSDSHLLLSESLVESKCEKKDLQLFQASAFNEKGCGHEASLLTSDDFATTESSALAIAGITPVIGYCGSAHSELSFVAAVLENYHRFLPGVPAWDKPKSDQDWNKSNCYFPEFSRQWFITEESHYRFGVVSLLEGGYQTFVVLSDKNTESKRPNRFLKISGFHLFPLQAESWEALKNELTGLRATAKQEANLRNLSRYYFENIVNGSAGKCRAVIIAEDLDDLNKELDLMTAGISSSVQSGGEFKTPRGSYVTVNPLGYEGKVSLVYPGAGSSYVGIGAEIFHLFPEVFELAEKQSRDVGIVMKDEVIYPRIQQSLSFKEKKLREMQFQTDIPSITETDTVYSWICSRIVMDVFGVKPSMAVGYSLGEANMFSSLDVWDKPLELKKRGDSSPIFREQLRGEMLSIRKQWGISADIPASNIWTTYTFKGDRNEVQNLVKNEEKVFLSMISTNDSVVIAGDPDGCARIIEALGVRAIQMGFVPALHVKPAYEQYENIASLYNHPVSEHKQDIKMYSTSCYLPVPRRSRSIAYAIAKCFCDPVDFPKLINKLYDDEARIFIEAGAGRSCSTWIDKILQDKDHLCVPLNAKGTEDQLTLARTMAKLFCHGVEVDLSPFYLVNKTVEPDLVTDEQKQSLYARP